MLSTKKREKITDAHWMKRSFWNSAPEFGNVVGAVDCENSTRTLRSACGSRRFHFFWEFHFTKFVPTSGGKLLLACQSLISGVQEFEQGAD